MNTMKIDVLGTAYTIQELTREEDSYLQNVDGYCDKTTHRIVVATPDADSDLGDFSVYRNKVMRHEIIHAFLFESGLHENWKHDAYGHDEMYVDWIAVQFPKMLQAFKDADAL